MGRAGRCSHLPHGSGIGTSHPPDRRRPDRYASAGDLERASGRDARCDGAVSGRRHRGAIMTRLPGLFVTGTDTSVGKTLIASEILRSLISSGRRVGALKPVATSAIAGPDGSLRSPDGMTLRDALGAEIPPG